MVVFIKESSGESPEVLVAGSPFTLSAPLLLLVLLFLNEFAVKLHQAMEGLCQDTHLFWFGTISSQGPELFSGLLLLLHCLLVFWC